LAVLQYYFGIDLLEAVMRSAEEVAVEADQARTLLERLQAKQYSFAERRAIVKVLVERITAEPPTAAHFVTPDAAREELCRIDFGFHLEDPRLALRGIHTPVTAEEAQAGAAGLLTALGATPAA
jgi:hypothetical protein